MSFKCKMKHLSVFLITSFALCLFSCKKEKQIRQDCFEGFTAQRQLTDAAAIIKMIDETYFIMEEGTYDERLFPCNLPDKFKKKWSDYKGKWHGVCFCKCSTRSGLYQRFGHFSDLGAMTRRDSHLNCMKRPGSVKTISCQIHSYKIILIIKF